MIDATLHALIIELIRTHAVDADAMHRRLLARGEADAAAFVGACMVEASAPQAPRLVHDGGNEARD